MIPSTPALGQSVLIAALCLATLVYCLVLAAERSGRGGDGR